MVDNFTSARMESTRINKYLLKQFKNKSEKSFLTIYINSKGEVTPNLKRVACLYVKAHSSSLDTYITDDSLEKITDEQINEIYGKIRDGASKNFVKFYESYRRKIDKSYNRDIIDNAFGDLRTAYSTYRMANNPLWNLEEEQVTEDEMSNLYNILVPQIGENSVNPISKEEK